MSIHIMDPEWPRAVAYDTGLALAPLIPVPSNLNICRLGVEGECQAGALEQCPEQLVAPP